MAMTLEQFPLLWLVMPLLVGSVAVAEERKLGTFQSNLCLPASRRVQFLTKLVIATALGIVFGGVLPLLVERLAPHNSITGNATGLAFLGDTRPIELLQLTGSVGLTLLAFYGSTLTRNALQGMGVGLLGAVVVCLVIIGAQHAGDSEEFILWRGRLVGFIGWPVMTLTVLVLAYRNYSRLQPDFRAWVRNVATLLAALLCVAVATTTIFHRVWEAWLPEEPPHRSMYDGFSLMGKRAAMPGPLRPSRTTSGYLGINLQELTPSLAKEFKFDQSTGALVGYVEPNGPAAKAGLKTGDLVLQFDGQSVPDSRQLALAVQRTKPDSKVPIEIERDGSTRTLEITVGQMPNRRQIAQQNRAGCKLEATGSQKAAVLPDGRLWLQQRRARMSEQAVVNQGIVVWYENETGPAHAGFVTGSNWEDVALTQGGCFAIQADGTLWDVSETELGGSGAKRVGQDYDWEAITAGGGHFCALKSDGTLWEWGWKRTAAGVALTSPVQVGTDNDWTAICDSWTMSAAIKADGSVWRWTWNSKTHNRPGRWLTGACSEPVSIALSYCAVATVCADGTLWIGGDLTNSVYARLIGLGLALPPRAANEMVQWGNDSDWKEIRFVSWGKAVGIKRDRTLWEWDATHVFGPPSDWVVPPRMPSRYADWLAVCEDNNAFLALARDGSLCLWGDPGDIGVYNDYWNRRFLMPSRIKARRIADLAR
jgi:hypothetical protein